MTRIRHIHRSALPAALLVLGCGGGTLSGMGTGGQGGGGGGGSTGTGGVAGGQNCGQVDVPSQPVQADILILLDASGSMSEDASGATCAGGCGASSKWSLATAAIERIVGDTQDRVNWGLKLFPDIDNACGVSSSPVVGVGPFNQSAIASTLASHTDSGGGVAGGGNSPMRAAAQAGENHLRGLTDPNRKLILLITDGAPDCKEGAADTTVDDTSATNDVLDNARIFGIPTIVVGIGTAGGPADGTLNALAFTGEQTRPGGPPFYYPASDTDGLTATLQALVKSDAECLYQLPPPPNNNLSSAYINVTVDGASIPEDGSHVSGWDYTDDSETAIQFYGPVCDALEAGQAKNVSIGFLCII